MKHDPEGTLVYRAGFHRGLIAGGLVALGAVGLAVWGLIGAHLVLV